MRKVFLTFAVVFLLIIFNSCKKSDTTSSRSQNYFLTATINGQPYTVNEVTGFDFSDRSGCITNKRYQTSVISQIDVAAYFLDVYIHHYQNYADFNGTSSGPYSIFEDIIGSVDNACNMDLAIALDDNAFSFPGSSCALQTNSLVNNITNVTRVSETSTDVKYDVEGNFSCNFKNNNNVVIPVTGSYKTYFEVLK